METLLNELTRGIPTSESLGRVAIRLIAAIILGAIIGYERERAGKAVGMRTHILVMLGTCLLVVSGFGLTPDGVSHIIQGIVTGIGFLGAGSILKTMDEQHHVRGLTTAAGVWMAAAIGVTIGLGALGIAIIATFLALVVLVFLKSLERRIDPKNIFLEK